MKDLDLTSITNEEARSIIQEATRQAEEILKKATRELQEVLGPHGSVSRLQAGAVKISRGGGIRVFADGVQKTTIEPDGDFFAGADIGQPRSTSFSVFSDDQTYNNEDMGRGDVLFGDNSTGVENIKFDASEGKLLFRIGTTINLYIDADGTIVTINGSMTIGGDLQEPNRVVITNSDGEMTTDESLKYIITSYAPGSTITSGSVAATSATGVQITGLTIGDWYAIDGANGPWGSGIGSNYNFELSSDGITFSGSIGRDNFAGFLLVLPSLAAYAEAIDTNYGRVYFQALTTSVWFRCADSNFGDNGGTFGYILKSATVGLKRITLDDVEYTLAKLPLAIHAATAKTTPIDGDEFPLWDSAVALLKNVTWANIKATLKTYFDTIYSALGHTHTAANAFSTISVSGQSDVVADSGTDTLTLVAGTNITITTVAGTDTITITASEIMMQDGVTFPPVPLETEDGTDWLYSG